MHKCGRLDGLARRLAAKELLSQLSESLVNRVEQPIHRRTVPRLNVAQETSDLRRRLHLHRQ